jgi:hypothetical protein
MGDQQHDAHRDLPRGTWCDTTGKRGAVRNNSGEPVDHSGPGLRVGPTTSPTADRKSEACPPDSLLLSQHKSGRESESGALSAASEASGELRSAATQPSSSLDKIQNNRNTRVAASFKLWGAIAIVESGRLFGMMGYSKSFAD